MIPSLERHLEVRLTGTKNRRIGEVVDDALALLKAVWHLRNATSVGERVRLWGRPVVRNSGKLVIGNRVTFIASAIPIQLTTEQDGVLEIGDRVFMNYGCSIIATKRVSIGADCKIGMDVLIMDNDFHQIDPAKRGVRPASSPVILEQNVWLGARVIVLAGVKVGADSVIAAGSVVVSDVPPRSVAAGQPARVIKTLDANHV